MGKVGKSLVGVVLEKLVQIQKSEVGIVAPYAGEKAPNGWLLCDGSAVNRSTYAQLFAVIGTRYGSGDGRNTFNLPDMRGRVPVGVTGSSDPLGKTEGEKHHTLTPYETPKHRHYIRGKNPDGRDGANQWDMYIEVGSWKQKTSSNVESTGYTGIPTTEDGSGAPHNNMQPSLYLNYIIKT